MEYRQAYKIKEYKRPIIKNFKDVKQYDVARFEYGDDDNWVNAVIINVEKKDMYGHPCLEITFATKYNAKEEKCYQNLYSEKDETLEIVGRAQKIVYKDEDENTMAF